ncbi:MAG: lysylphosphatidylglycerol synthase transmembrane domain-containing protein [Chloroflexota bacterium]|nr:lysylphosphatidylglycerol synthase transmembrane domain-containing protein [Chloroflexota bacterium]
MTGKRVLLVLGSMIVSAASVALILRDVNIDDVASSISGADGGQLSLAFLFVALSMFTRGIRWWGLLGKGLPLIKAVHLVNVTFLGNQLPLRLGEAARSLLASREGVSIEKAAASIVVERLIDTLLVVLMIAATVAQLPDAPAYVTVPASRFGALALVAFLCLLALARHPQKAKRFLSVVTQKLPVLNRSPLQRIVDNLLDGLGAIANLRTLVFTLVWSLIAWTTSLAAFYFLHQALGIEVNYAQSVPLGVSLAALGIALPFTIAAVGPFEAAIIVTGQIVGMDSLAAISLGFLFHGISVFGYIVFGSAGLLALGASPGTAAVEASKTAGR